MSVCNGCDKAGARDEFETFCPPCLDEHAVRHRRRGEKLARAEIIAKLRERTRKANEEAFAKTGDARLRMSYYANDLCSVADWIEAGCP